VKDLKATLAKLAALNIQPMPGATAKQAFVMSPDNLKVSLKEDTSLTTSVATDEVLEKVTSRKDAAEWYSRHFGAKIVKDGEDTVAQIPGMNIRFLETTEAVAPTQGRALDHLGMEVRNLEAFMAKLAAGGGVNIATGYRGINPTQIPPLTGIAFVVDPWGTRIELNEGFRDVK
jgi:catechol 2,3-dioxygenase-like lactoylglutathione lyase family enzyme